MRPARSSPLAAATDGASAATATTHSAAPTAAPATLRTLMLPPQETCPLFVTGAAARQGRRASFRDFREAVPRVSEFFATLCTAGLNLNARLILRHEYYRTLPTPPAPPAAQPRASARG